MDKWTTTGALHFLLHLYKTHTNFFLWQSLWQCVNLKDTYKLYGTVILIVGTVLFSSSIFPPKFNRNVPDLGVPQGSVLSPLPFILYTTLLSCLVEKADDTQLNHSSITVNHLTITQTWSVHFKIVSKILGYGLKKSNSNWIMIDRSYLLLAIIFCQHGYATLTDNLSQQ